MFVELASNLVWLVAVLSLLGAVRSGLRRGAVRLPDRSAILLALMLGFILLPAISISDDLMASRQATLPLASQTWRLASDGASVALDSLFALAVCLILLMVFAEMFVPVQESWQGGPIAARLARSQRLRPPPALA